MAERQSWTVGCLRRRQQHALAEGLHQGLLAQTYNLSSISIAKIRIIS